MKVVSLSKKKKRVNLKRTPLKLPKQSIIFLPPKDNAHPEHPQETLPPTKKQIEEALLDHIFSKTMPSKWDFKQLKKNPT